MLVYDVTNSESFERIRFWHEELFKVADPLLPLLLIGNKIDKEDERKVSEREGKELAEELGAIYMEVNHSLPVVT